MTKSNPSIVKRNYFKVKDNHDGTFRVAYRKRGVMMIDSVCTESEIETHRKQYDKEVNHKVVESHIPQLPKPKVMPIDVVNYFYKELLQPKDYYVLDGMNIKLFNGEDNAQLWIPINNEDFVTEINVVKFFLNRKNPDLTERKGIMYANHKQVKGGYFLIGIMPTINFHNNRAGFAVPKVGTEISQLNAKRLWPKINEEFAYEKIEVKIGGIPKNDRRKKNNLAQLSKHNTELRKIELEEFKRIMCVECVELTPDVAEIKLKSRIKNSKWYKTQNKLRAIEQRQGYAIDKSVRKEKRRIDLNRVLAR